MSNYEAVIGLEVHVELLTETKLFCACSTSFGADPNSQVCEVCLGLPGGVLPLLNHKAVENALKASTALNCEIVEHITFDRKNYFYADLPKGYQISQFFSPTGTKGFVEIESNGETKKIGIKQLHLEEDTGKLFHIGDIISSPYSQVDFNRAGVPLIEIVTEPDIRSAEEARLFLQKLKSILQYCEISDCKMEEGSLRCDANVSIRPKGHAKMGSKTELKNMNSFRSVYKGIEYEITRQQSLLGEGNVVPPETRHWDEVNEYTKAMRSKFVSADYRCFPDPNLLPYKLEAEWITEIRNSLPEMPDFRYKRLVNELGLPEYDAEIITASKEMADFFDNTLEYYNDPKTVSNWIMGDVMMHLNAQNITITQSKITPAKLGKLLVLINIGTISGKIAKEIFEEMFTSGEDPQTIIDNKDISQISDEETLSHIIEEVISENPKSVEDYKSGKKKAIKFLVGQIMKQTKGQANPQLVNKLLEEKLSE